MESESLVSAVRVADQTLGVEAGPRSRATSLSARRRWKGIGRIFVLAYVLDVFYQLVEWRTLRPFGALITALILAVIPYVLPRGPVNRLLRFSRARRNQIQ